MLRFEDRIKINMLRNNGNILGSVQHTTLIGGDHVFDVNESIFSSSLFQQLQSLHDKVSQVESLALVVFDLVPCVFIAVPKDIEDGQNLSIIGHQCFPNHISTEHQFLDYFKHH